MIRAVNGLPRSGKSYFYVKFIIHELVNSERWVVTTLTELDLPALQAYLLKKYPQKAIDVAMRVQVIPKTEARRWYRYRGSYTLPEFDYDPKGGELPEALDARLQAYFGAVSSNENDHGVCYFVDEAHRFLCAEEYARFAKVCMFYLTQHGHLDDNFWWCSQFPEQVVIHVRRLTQDTHVLRNQAFEAWLCFAKPKRFVWSLYYRCPESREKGQEPMETGTATLDLEIAACYRTRGALGGTSPLAETPPKRRKLPFWALPVAGAVALVAVIAAVRQLPDLVSAGLRRITGAAVQGAREGGALPDVVNTNVQPGVNKDTAAAVEKRPPIKVVKPKEEKAAERRAVYWVRKGDSYRVGLTDGTTIDESEVARVTGTAVITRRGESIPLVRDWRARTGKEAAGERAAPRSGGPLAPPSLVRRERVGITDLGDSPVMPNSIKPQTTPLTWHPTSKGHTLSRE